ncbi:MAG TPA: Do family serine endopeptidase [Methylomirabilota bacterium]|nr:Do family serine endopeptidase [Methylomirabilota bacterium]
MVTVGGFAGFLAVQYLPIQSGAAAAPGSLDLRVDADPVGRELNLATSFAPAVEQAAPSVVSVSTKRTITTTAPSLPPIMRELFPGMPDSPRERQAEGLGSGVIVTEDGYILTNNHVVDGADEVTVKLAEGVEEYAAEIIGTDPYTDIAVLKIEAKGLPAIRITDSEHLRVGDVVLAIGNPLGVGQTVTMGIVSALNRRGDILHYEDFIQTDAAINRGNSGGALVDAEGRLVGVNTAIISSTGGSQGIGFAVPSNLARSVLERILRYGKVVRGFLGVDIQNITPALAEMFELPVQSGALVAAIHPDTPADRSDLKEGDVIIEFNGRKITERRQLQLLVSETAPDTEVELKLIRDGKETTVSLVLAELPEDAFARSSPTRPGLPSPEPGDSSALEGLEVADLNPQFREQFNIPDRVRGVLVMGVSPGSLAAAKNIGPGDVIQEFDRKQVNETRHLRELSRGFGNRPVLLRVWSGGGSRYVVLDPRGN